MPPRGIEAFGELTRKTHQRRRRAASASFGWLRGPLGATGSAGLDAAARRRPVTGCARPAQLLGVEALISAPLSSPSSSSRCSSPAPCLCGSTTRQRAACCGGIFHASFDAVINQLSYDVVPAANAARFLIFSAVIVLAATTVISPRRASSKDLSRPIAAARGLIMSTTARSLRQLDRRPRCRSTPRKRPAFGAGPLTALERSAVRLSDRLGCPAW